MIGFILLGTIALVYAQAKCGTQIASGQCIDSSFGEPRLPDPPVDTARFLQVDDPLASKGGPGMWQINNDGRMRENSNIRPENFVARCASESNFGTRLLLKRARPFLAMDKQRYVLRTTVETTDAGGFFGLIFAYEGPNNHFRVSVRTGDNCINVQKRENARWYNLDTGRISEPLATRTLYQLYVTYNATHIRTKLNRAVSGALLADFTVRGRNNDLNAWHNKDVGLYSSANRNPVLFHSWLITNGANEHLLPVNTYVPPAPTPAPTGPTPSPSPADTPLPTPAPGPAPSYNESSVPATCRFGQWSALSECSRRCDGGVQSRTRNITIGASECDEFTTQLVQCNTQACPAGKADCVPGAWSTWSTCFRLSQGYCGTGVRRQTRTPIQLARQGGEPCTVDDLFLFESCNVTCPPAAPTQAECDSNFGVKNTRRWCECCKYNQAACAANDNWCGPSTPCLTFVGVCPTAPPATTPAPPTFAPSTTTVGDTTTSGVVVTTTGAPGDTSSSGVSTTTGTASATTSSDNGGTTTTGDGVTTSTDVSVTTTGEPVTTTAEPVTTTAERVTTTAEPVTTTAEPVTTTAEPVTTTAEPVTTTGEPVTTTGEPVTTTASTTTTIKGGATTTTTAAVGTTDASVSGTTLSAPTGGLLGGGEACTANEQCISGVCGDNRCFFPPLPPAEVSDADNNLRLGLGIALGLVALIAVIGLAIICARRAN